MCEVGSTSHEANHTLVVNMIQTDVSTDETSQRILSGFESPTWFCSWLIDEPAI